MVKTGEQVFRRTYLYKLSNVLPLCLAVVCFVVSICVSGFDKDSASMKMASSATWLPRSIGLHLTASPESCHYPGEGCRVSCSFPPCFWSMDRVKSSVGIKFWEIWKRRLSNLQEILQFKHRTLKEELQKLYFSACEQTNREGCFMLCHETENATDDWRNIIPLAAYFLETTSKE